MPDTNRAALILSIGIVIGLSLLAYLLGSAAKEIKRYERSVTVKGLSEREVQADIVIWPIQFTDANNDLGGLYQSMDVKSRKIGQYLIANGIENDEISYSSPAITDKSAQQYGGSNRAEFRYTATQTVTVYSENIDPVRSVMGSLSELGKQGIVFTGGNYDAQTDYLFTRLNDVKPAMVEEATRKAREVAEKFAQDSQSRLGKIKRASQGQFAINDRDRNNPHIKKVRVVSTVEYYLAD